MLEFMKSQRYRTASLFYGIFLGLSCVVEGEIFIADGNLKRKTKQVIVNICPAVLKV